ncbi:glycosyltransferase family 117 protein [Mucilaginibacter agri]|uniref:DUF2723 domain-containing protein n=1 Tax=Mucilaginibacter agri TaxID=2695265 RepID=A0A965ZKH2_9SPHI|nr:DUF2723 domain-containing protein [Mucilaginibacter agri]NCD71301.1 DUF2723 domain-containing protein [Mucilaginibacter agri]
MSYQKINNLFGWLCFLVAATTYILTLEPSVSFWDCGEFIACAYRLQVSHQPGYPMFAMLGKAFSLLSMGDKTKVAYFTNMGFALSSSAAIMFLFWTITAMAKKLLIKRGETQTTTQTIMIMGAGLVGALGFIFTDTFWFSAVETVVFSPAMLCTAVVFWAIFKWEAQVDEPGSDRWLVLIAYVMGLSVGIHLLNLLTIPAMTLVYYFRRYKNINVKNTIIAFLAGVVLLAVVQFGIIQYTVKLFAYADLFAVNSLGMPFNSGALIFLALLVALIAYGIVYSIRKHKPALNLALVCLAFIYFGYSSFTMVPIRAHADTNLNNYHADNAFSLGEYLSRIQYVAPPLLYGPYFDAKAIDQKEGITMYRKGPKSYEVVGKKQELIYDHNTIMPRIFSTDANDVAFYKDWLRLGDGQTPTFSDNLSWLFSWQIYQMYFRYFLWNFVGRYNDIDGQASTHSLNGNWTTGLLDHSRHLPDSIMKSNTYTPLYALPLIVGLLGMVYQYRRNKQDALVIAVMYFFMGIAIVLYVNQYNLQPRERDYSYVGSFYAFAIWIGLGVLAMADLLMKKLNARTASYLSIATCLLAVPVLLASKEWKDHDRSTKTIAHDLAYNYLISCPKNAILFNSADNETYPLWYVQEVENVRPDVRLINVNLFSAGWNVRQMQHPINEAAAAPISMPYDKYKDGVRDIIRFNDAKLPDSVELKDVFEFITSDDMRAKVEYQDGSSENYLPTRNFKITVNKKQVLDNHVVTADQQNKIADTIEWKYPGQYLTKAGLGMMDILVHNDWKRPICFATSMTDEEIIGLRPHLYKEGLIYRLIPFKTEKNTTDNEQTNTMAMYNNMVNKYKWGNIKNARYLDSQTVDVFYPMLLSNWMTLTQNLAAEGHHNEAVNTLHKMDEVMPDLTPYIDVAARKYYIADTAYHLKDINLGNKYVNSINTYVKDQLDYNYRLLKDNADSISLRDVQMGMSLMQAMAGMTRDNNQLALNTKLEGELKDYENKFSAILGKQ